MTNTEHYNLNLPEGDDIYNIRDFNQNSEILDEVIYDMEDEIREMKQTFRAGVDACYEACKAKGSTPDSHSLDDVVNGILSIQSGGALYSMFPQDVPGRITETGGSYPECNIPLSNDEDIFIGYIRALEDNQIHINFWSNITLSGGYDSFVIRFSLVIDNSITIPDIATYTYDPNDVDLSDHEFIFLYTLPEPLSAGYHTLSLRPHFEDEYYHDLLWPMFSFYGYNFTADPDPGGYLSNGGFVEHFLPEHFVIPTNPLQYTLQEQTQGYSDFESVVSAMNEHFANTFDSGVSYHMKAIDYYRNGYPEITDTLVYDNGKFVYTHPDKRDSYSTYTCEYHYFVLPVKGELFRGYRYLNLHGRMVDLPEWSYRTGRLDVAALIRTDPNTVEQMEEYSYGLNLNSLSAGEAFVAKVQLPEIQTTGIGFIVICFTNMFVNANPYTLEIDRIWGTNPASSYDDD